MISERTINSFLQAATSEKLFTYYSNEPYFWLLFDDQRITNETAVPVMYTQNYTDTLPELVN